MWKRASEFSNTCTILVLRLYRILSNVPGGSNRSGNGAYEV